MNVLVVDDEADLLENLKDVCESFGWSCQTAKSYQEAIALSSQYSFDIAIIDLALGMNSGVELAAKLSCKIVIMTALVAPSTRQLLKKKKLTYIEKPFTLTDFKALIEKTVKDKGNG